MEAVQSTLYLISIILLGILLIEMIFLINCLRNIMQKLDFPNQKCTKTNNTLMQKHSPSVNTVKRSPVAIDEETAYLIEKNAKRKPNPVL